MVNNQPVIFHGCHLVTYNYTASLLGNIIIMLYIYSGFPNCVYCSVFKGHHQPFKANSKSPCKGEQKSHVYLICVMWSHVAAGFILDNKRSVLCNRRPPTFHYGVLVAYISGGFSKIGKV